MNNIIDEYIGKTKLAIDECFKNIKKGKIDIAIFYKVVEKYFDEIYRYIEDNLEDIDDNTFARIHSLENSLNRLMVNFSPNLTMPNEVTNTDEYLLKVIVYCTRKKLIQEDSVDFTTDSLRKLDSKANECVKDVCSHMGLAAISFNIARSFGIPKNHNVCLVKVNDSYYLIDCTYQQYFLLGQNFKNRYIKSASHIATCEVGARILARNRDGAIELLENGFISVDDPMFEDYFKTMYNQFNREPLTKEEYLNTIIKNKKVK